MHWMGILLLLVGLGLGLLIIPFGLPGVAVIFVSALIYGLLTDFRAAIGMNFFVVLCVLTVAAETSDNWLMVLGAKKYGASTGAIWLSFLGGALGGLLLGPLLAIVLGFLGPFLGAFVGAFLVVLLYEYYRSRQMRQALRAAWGAVPRRKIDIVLSPKTDWKLAAFDLDRDENAQLMREVNLFSDPTRLNRHGTPQNNDCLGCPHLLIDLQSEIAPFD